MTNYFTWGDNCEGWILSESKQLAVIKERMPPGTKEVSHYHEYSEQTFYILSGVATFTVDGQLIEAFEGVSINIFPKSIHHIANEQQRDLIFLVISSPPTDNDRIEI